MTLATPAPDGVRTLFLDDALVVVDKPAGLLAVPGRGERDCVAARVQAAIGDALVVHRLDQATSGLMLMARGAPAQRRLSEGFAQRLVAKRYVAIVDGWLESDEGLVDLPLSSDWPRRPRQRIDLEGGKPSQTRYRVLARLAAHDGGRGRTRLELEPLTGRSHQLRVHLHAIGHPIVGDTLYAPELAAPRLMLHACALALPHPSDGRPIAFSSPAPF